MSGSGHQGEQPMVWLAGQKEAEDPGTFVVVEDEPDDYALLSRALGKVCGPVPICWARTAREALETLHRLEGEARRVVVVADIKLPGMDGFELLQLVKARAASLQLKFVFLTGRRDDRTELQAKASGADGFYYKPAQHEDLLGIARCLQQLIHDVPCPTLPACKVEPASTPPPSPPL